jgi:hypothetical protein
MKFFKPGYAIFFLLFLCCVFSSESYSQPPIDFKEGKELCLDTATTFDNLNHSGLKEKTPLQIANNSSPVSIRVWQLLMSPQGRLRKAADLLHDRFLKLFGLIESKEHYKNVLDQFIRNEVSIATDEEITEVENTLSKIAETKPAIREDQLSLLRILCFEHPWVLDCKNAVTEIYRETKLVVWSSIYLSLPHIWQEVLTDLSLAPGLAHSVKQILEKVHDKKPLDHSFVHELLAKNFEMSGLSEEKSKQTSWKILALYGSRGASVQELLYRWFYKTGINYQRYASLYSTLFSYLTLANMDEPFKDITLDSKINDFAYPGQVATRCFMPREYHFWYAAYLARHLRTQGFSQAASFLAPYFYSLGYGFAIVAVGRNPVEIYFEKSRGPYTVSNMVTVAFNSAGAAWGSRFEADGLYESFYGQLKGYSIDSIISLMYHLSLPIKPNWTKKELHPFKPTPKLFLWWRKMVSPEVPRDLWGFL